MQAGAIVLITDRPDQSLTLHGEISRFAVCETVRFNQPVAIKTKPIGVVADATLNRRETAAAIRSVAATSPSEKLPMVFLLRSAGETAMRYACELGATLCLPAHTPPGVVAHALLHDAMPAGSEPKLRVERGVARAVETMADLFAGARGGTPIAVASVDASLDPILSAVRDGGLHRWLDKVWTHDDATYQHCLLVAGLGAQFALHLGFGSADREHFVKAALLHDVGKAKIPLTILNKPGRLDGDEMQVMRTHAAMGYDALKSSGVDAVTLGVVRHHHEMLDGSGYPDGLSGDSISDAVRLLTICDIYAALTERRPYKKPMAMHEAMAILSAMTGRLEEGLVDSFGRAMQSAR